MTNNAVLQSTFVSLIQPRIQFPALFGQNNARPTADDATRRPYHMMSRKSSCALVRSNLDEASLDRIPLPQLAIL